MLAMSRATLPGMGFSALEIPAGKLYIRVEQIIKNKYICPLSSRSRMTTAIFRDLKGSNATQDLLSICVPA
jgi:hypothetical protein